MEKKTQDRRSQQRVNRNKAELEGAISRRIEVLKVLKRISRDFRKNKRESLSKADIASEPRRPSKTSITRTNRSSRLKTSRRISNGSRGSIVGRRQWIRPPIKQFRH